MNVRASENSLPLTQNIAPHWSKNRVLCYDSAKLNHQEKGMKFNIVQSCLNSQVRDSPLLLKIITEDHNGRSSLKMDQEGNNLPNDLSTRTASDITIQLLHLANRTKYEIVQENGQRRLTCPELVENQKERPKGAEVFLGRLPRDCYEDELEPYLSKIGKLLELRLMLDFSGSTRGYAFALYENAKIAREACRLLNNSEIRPGHRIGVVKSMDNCRLFFGGVPKDKTKEDFMAELSKILNGITDIYLYPNSEDRTQNRGFIFVEFKDHRSAAMARRKLIPGRVVLWDHEIAVDWADPEPGDPVDEEVMETVTALFVRNLHLELSQQKMKDMILKGTNAPILKLKKLGHFAFLHYETRDIAASVLDLLTQPGGLADREGWEIRWAKPIGAVKNVERQRSIEEATAASRGKMERSPGSDKSSSRRNFSKGSSKSIPKNEGSDLPKLNYPLILQKFVAEKFQAQCHMETTESTSGFVCRIAIIKNNQIVFDYFGDPWPTSQKAVTVAARTVYHKLSPSHLFSSLVDQIPVPPPPYIYQPVNNLCQNQCCNPLLPQNPIVHPWQMSGFTLEP
ncbi:probable RNA-binding protein 46 [Belonocnema kinseyi]|uniref:probable RNA-binding protein 46 n=1 Tax=Belonocnema kinseyi TaxID=2817044 RepID=UPI00143D3C7B|nr:probable RNA-binding protein 46 [Belonocnema kinseyi]